MSHSGEDLSGPVTKDPSAAATITISLTIDNTYEDGETIVTTVTDAVIPTPPSPDDEDAHSAWCYNHIREFTGTGQPKGEAWHDVTVTACSDPALVGQTYEFGY